TVMLGMGDALMGTGVATGENRALEAATAAISSPLLEEVSIEGAEGVLVNICGGKDMTLFEVNDATSVIFDASGSDANIIFGAVIDENLHDEMRVTVIATGFNTRQRKHQALDREKKFIELTRPDLKNTDVPTFIREKQMMEKAEQDNIQKPEATANTDKFVSDNLDIPTFLRKQMD
ncbi:MAG: cell division protein FtsZ, partial [bacterium]|nr:cell division protein FtsZ [bacterium]